VKLILSNSKGEQLKPISWWNTYPFSVGVGAWLNDQQLWVNGVLFNLYTGKKQMFKPETFTGIAQDQYGFYPFVLDPTLTRVMYPYDPIYIALADLGTKQVLTTLTDFTAARPEVAWLPDGSHVAVVGTVFVDQAQEIPADEIFIVDKDGKQVQQATHLSAYYPISGLKGAQTYHLQNLAWSPDGRYIAFWDNSLRLYVLDTETDEVTSYCKWGEKPPPSLVTPGPSRWWPDEQAPIWSPDGKQLLIGYRDTNDALHTVILDIENNVAFSIANDMIPVGWMVKEP
jgi:Tol biopolymer transport system component